MLSPWRKSSLRTACSIQDPLFYTHRATLAKLAEAARLPLVAGHADYVRAGALAAYALDNRSIVRRSGH